MDNKTYSEVQKKEYMKKNKIITSLLLLFFLFNLLSSMIIVKAETLYESWDEASRVQYLSCQPDSYRAQTFQPGIKHYLTKVSVPIFREGNPGTDCTIGIYTTTGGVPTETYLGIETFNGNSLGTSELSYPNVVDFTFSPNVTVEAGTTYAIIIKCPSGDGSNRIWWQSSDDDADYPDGDIFYNNSGTWAASSYTGDLYFYEYGDPYSGGGSPPGAEGLNPPADFTGSILGNSINLSWTKDANATNTYIERKTSVGAGDGNAYGFEGFGSDTQGAYTGSSTPNIYYVTNLNDEGTGSFRSACEASGPRVVIFNVSGTIWADSFITIDDPYITIAGQTAPSPGICVQGSLQIYTHDVIVQHIRVRLGSGTSIPRALGDCIQIGESGHSVYNVVIDHCSVSWAIDENMGTWYPANDITWQWNIIAEGITVHSCGLIANPDNYDVTVHHNLFAHNEERSPLVGCEGDIEIINNLVYNWQWDGTNCIHYSGYGPTYANIVGNYYKRGLGTVSNYGGISVWDAEVPSLYYIHNNYDSVYRTSQSQDDWDCVEGSESLRSNVPLFTQSTNPVTVDNVMDNYNIVLNNVGARPLDRDTADTRVVNSVIAGTGNFVTDEDTVGGFPSLTYHYVGFNVGADPHGDDDSDGLSNLEELLISTADDLLYYPVGEGGGGGGEEIGVWGLGNGSFVYNGTGDYVVDSSLDWSTYYYYQAWSWNATGFSENISFFNASTTSSSCSPPTSISGSMIDDYLNITWSNGYGADTTLIRKKTGSYPSSVTDGTECQNSSLTFYNESYDDNTYYSLWSYNATLNIYSSRATYTYGGFIINCYDDNTSEALTFNVVIVNKYGTEQYTVLDATNPLTIDLSLCPTGTDTMIIVSSANHSTRTFIMDVSDNFWYTLNVYLPYTTTQPSNQTYLYQFNVFNELGNPEDDVYVTIKKQVNDSGFEAIYILKTDASGSVYPYLIPDQIYIVILEKDGFETTYTTYIPSTVVFVANFIIKYEVEEIPNYVQPVITVERSGAMIFTNFTDSMDETSSVILYFYYYNSTTGNETFISTVTYSNYSSFNHVLYGIDANLSYKVVVFYVHTYYGEQVFTKVLDPIITSVSSALNTILNALIGEHSLFVWTNIILWIAFCVMMFSIDKKDAGKGLILVGGILALVTIVGFADILSGMVPSLFVLVGVIVEWQNRGK